MKATHHWILVLCTRVVARVTSALSSHHCHALIPAMPQMVRTDWSAQVEITVNPWAHDQGYASGPSSKIGVLGAYSRDLLSLCARGPMQGVARRVRPVRCGFATEGSRCEALHRAELMQPYAATLINRDAGHEVAIFGSCLLRSQRLGQMSRSSASLLSAACLPLLGDLRIDQLKVPRKVRLDIPRPFVGEHLFRTGLDGLDGLAAISAGASL